MSHLKPIFIAGLVAAACSASADASPFGPDGFDEVGAALESAREARPNSHPEWLADVFEHTIGPETAPQADERGQKILEASHQPRNPKE